MASAQNTRLSTLVVSAAAIAASVVGSYQLYISGNTYVTGTANAVASSGGTLTYGGGIASNTNLGTASCTLSSDGTYVNCYQSVVATATGGCLAAGCTSRSYNVASITKPYTGSGTIRHAEFNCRKSGISRAYTIGTVAATTASGNDIANRVTVNSGSTTLTNNSGSQVWGNVKPILKVSTSASIQSNQCMLRVWSSGNYQ